MQEDTRLLANNWQIVADNPPVNSEVFDTKAGEWSTLFVAIVKLPRPSLGAEHETRQIGMTHETKR